MDQNLHPQWEEQEPLQAVPDPIPTDDPQAEAEDVTLPASEPLPQPEPPVPVEEIPAEAKEDPRLKEPELGQELTPDDHAMDCQGMLGHNEEEPPFDLSILEGLDLGEPAPQPEPPAEDVNDQEYRDNGKDFDALYEAPPPQPAPPTRHRIARKGRPKRKKGEGLLGIPNILVTFVWLALILAIGVTAGRMLWVCAADVLAFGREDRAVTVTVYEADSMEDITEKLYNAGLIRYRSLFNLYASISDAQEDIKPGIYDLNTRYDYHALVNFMSPSSSRAVINLTIPEGYTCRQIFELLEENRVCTAVDAAAYAANGELNDYWFLEGVERGTENCLEGYLFPDTYEFYKNSTPREALQRMLNNFEIKFSEEMRQQIGTLNATLGSSYTVQDIAIIASLIERESASPKESAKIAGVIYNRLHNWGDTPAFLNIDAAIVYAQGGEADTIDTSLDSPYNTYRNTGLTPGPIANPGLASLQAALQPESHEFYYYVLNPDTSLHQFSATQDEHNAWIQQFYG